jgi:hypothetical protein
MKCPACQQHITTKATIYQVKGLRYGTLPGTVYVYHCAPCHQSFRFVKIQESLLIDWAEQWEQRRREWIAEKAHLAQKLYWLTQPTTYPERKLQELRRGLIALVERTF